MMYLIENGKICTEACEINVVHHCNLSCRACSHISPRMPKYYCDPSKVYRDLSILARYYQPEHVRLLGGEPLLHPALIEVLDAVNKSRITECIRIITNGIKLSSMTRDFWIRVNEIHVSIYPGMKIENGMLEEWKRLSREYKVSLTVKHFDHFREAYSEMGTSDTELIQKIYDTCQIAQIWRCHNVSDGFFFRCPQSIFIPKFQASTMHRSILHDGIEIHDKETFGTELLSYLSSPQPLRACMFCLGSVGVRFSHAQESRKAPLSQRTSEEIIDWDYLERLTIDPSADNGCWTE